MKSNRHDGRCAGCGIHVLAGAGVLTGRPGRWRVTCQACRPVPPAAGLHAGWHRGPLASFDVETTGVDPLTDRIISYAMLDDLGESSGLIDPGVPIPAAAAAVHGLDADALRGAPSPVEGVASVLAWLASMVERSVPVVVFNAPYDLTMLGAEARRWGLPEPDWSRLLVIDPYVIDWGIERGTLGPRRLVDVARYYGVDISHAHDAMCDARAALEVARQLGACHPRVGTLSLADLMAYQQQWYAERAEDWNRWARTAGRELDDPTGWPLAA